ncbi:MAG: NADH pyrophosphatase, partial [Altererythrobacter ishigakiensis]|nr:NADH pyrophosphatase [Altererythrobacter ishigakiensis]
MNWKARLLALDELMPSLDDNNRLVWGTLADAPEDAELVFLGIDRTDGGEKPCFAAVPAKGDASPRMANPQLWALMATLD